MLTLALMWCHGQTTLTMSDTAVVEVWIIFADPSVP